MSTLPLAIPNLLVAASGVVPAPNTTFDSRLRLPPLTPPAVEFETSSPSAHDNF